MVTLWIDFAGTAREVVGSLTFGRTGDLSLDEANRFMHRITGELIEIDGHWWLSNRGTATRLVVFGSNGARIELPPQTQIALPLPSGSISFVAGPTPYQLTYRADAPAESTAPIIASGDATVEWGTALTDREAIYLTTFALGRLRGTSNQLLTYGEVADLWSVSEKTVDNTLQRVRGRLKAGGVRGTENLDGLITHLLANGRIGLTTLAVAETAHPDALGADKTT